jgi:hypothetical protein
MQLMQGDTDIDAETHSLVACERSLRKPVRQPFAGHGFIGDKV